MKRVFVVLGALWALAFATTSCDNGPSMDMKDSVFMPYYEIRGIVADGPFDIYIDPSAPTVEIRANEYLIKKVRYKMEGPTLYLGLDPVTIEENSTLEVYVPSWSLALLTLRGTAYTYVEYPQVVQGEANYSLSGASALIVNQPMMFTDNLTMVLAGGSEAVSESDANKVTCKGKLVMHLEGASAATLPSLEVSGTQDFTLEGASALNIAGRTTGAISNETLLTLSGASKVNAVGYSALNVGVSASGTSKADVRVGRSLVYRLSGLSALNYYYNNPALIVTGMELSGGSTVDGHADAQPGVADMAPRLDVVMPVRRR